jgi:DNA replication and repair protein RecF
MYLKSLYLFNFKNYGQLELEFSSKINCFIGANGVGKTNLLDSIYYLSMCKSYINPIDSQNIKYNEEYAVLNGEFSRLDKSEKIYCNIHKTKKKTIKRNKKNYRKLSEHIGLLPVVMISPIDSNLISGGSEERRKYIDRVISQYDKDYLEKLIRYNRALSQRNRLLKDFAKRDYFDPESLDIWDEQLISLGSVIYEKRKQFTHDLVPVFQTYYNTISEEKERVRLEYSSNLQEEDMRKLLTDNLEKDRILQYTTIGIHKDDLILSIEDHPIKKSGSQGQQKTFLVALKFAQFDFIKKIKEIRPILLLDDIFDKFDQQRVSQIIHLVSDNQFGQIFITDTSEDRLHKILKEANIDYRLFQVESEGVSG